MVTRDSSSHPPPRTNPPELTLRSLTPPVERQPGDRACAPADLRLVQAFVNTRWDLDRDLEERFADPSALAEWLVTRDLLEPDTRLSRVDLERVLDVREGLRALLLVNNSAPANPVAIARLNRALRGPGLFAQLGASAPPEFKVLRRDLDAAVALLATLVAVAQLDGGWPRLKACRGEHCGWAFYDHSRNQSGSWCAMSVCGSRAKARDYRRRRRS
jgi:predicted RNA-binding Zn ribbon-like protein